jgi:hypothetical protein
LEIAVTPHEYKAWFDGFTASDRRSPSLEKWAVINDRVADIDGFAVTRETYVHAFCEEFKGVSLRQALSNHCAYERTFDGEEAMHALGEIQARILVSDQPGIQTCRLDASLEDSSFLW